jgi:hypothetical protein
MDFGAIGGGIAVRTEFRMRVWDALISRPLGVGIYAFVVAEGPSRIHDTLRELARAERI